ncbi:MAG: MEDS domain-containing protein [Cyclobacteriaceae bacterium]
MESLRINNDGWTEISSQVFWGEIAPCDHVVQIYEDDEVFLDLLNGFVAGGISAGESVVVIATAAHLRSLNQLLKTAGIDVQKLRANNQYIPLDCDESLSRFMVNEWPDENLFNQFVSDILVKAKAKGRKVKAFGEMVATLWAKGQVGATVRLEHLWNKFCENEAFCLFCAYPQSGFMQDASESVMHICGAHSIMVAGSRKSKTEIFYKNVDQKRAV